MTKEEWESKQNALKKEYKYVPTGIPGQVKKIEATEESENDDDKKKRKEGKKISTQYGKYTGNVVDGKSIDKPTELQALKTNLEYMKKNASDQSDSPSNIYRPENEHKALNYNKKKEDLKQTKAK